MTGQEVRDALAVHEAKQQAINEAKKENPTGPEVKAIIAACHAKRKPLYDAIKVIDAEERKARNACPHEQRVPRHGDGVETAVCIYCENEEHVHTYRMPLD